MLYAQLGPTEEIINILFYSSGFINHMITILTTSLFIMVGNKPFVLCNVH